MRIAEPLIELLAIKLFEHDNESDGKPPAVLRAGWAALCEEDRESYRAVARGEEEHT